MNRHIARAVAIAVVAALGVLPGSAAPAGADPAPLGLACAPIDEGVRHCPGDRDALRVPSFDGVPLDVDVTLPLTGNGPWPTIVMLPGLGGDKAQLMRNVEVPPSNVPPDPPNTTHNDNVWFASRGYAVVNLATRGFGHSCGYGPFGLGTPGGAKLQTGPCAQGFWRAYDIRYDARDVQHLLGLLADQGVSLPTRNGATGFSGGGIVANGLGALNDRVMCDGIERGDLCDGAGDGDLVPWTSPAGTPMAMGAIYAYAAGTDLMSFILPNGRFLDFDDSTIESSTEPFGIYLASYMNGLLVLGQANGYFKSGASDPDTDVESAFALWNAGEPYSPYMQGVHEVQQTRRRPLAIKGDPAPMLLMNGFADDLQPIREALRLYNDLHRRFEHPDVVLMFGDYGHSRSGNRDGAAVAFNDIATAFFDSRLKGEGDGPAPGSVTVYETTCPAAGEGAAVERGPFTAPSWNAIAPGRVTFGNDEPQTVLNPGGDLTLGLQFDPILVAGPLGTEDPCKTVPPPTWLPGTVGFADHEVTETFTMVGRPTIRATIETTGIQGQLNGRLWDVDPEGNHRLITRGVYRLLDNEAGELVYQLNGNAYTFEAGHTILLELAPSDTPHFRASTLPFTVQVENLSIELPVLADDAALDSGLVADGSPPTADSANRTLPATGAGLVLASLLLLGVAGAARAGVTTP